MEAGVTTPSVVMREPPVHLVPRSRASVWFMWTFVLSGVLSLTIVPLSAVQGQIVELEDYVGSYELTPVFQLTVTLEGGVLYLQPPGQPRTQLVPLTGHEFVIVGKSLRIIFGVRQNTGEVVDLVFEQGGVGRRATKLPEGAILSISARADLTEDILNRYVGVYEEQPGFAITITRDGDHLLARLTELIAVSIFPQSETEFFYQDTGARIVFRLETDGVVTALTFYQGDSAIEMPRVDD